MGKRDQTARYGTFRCRRGFPARRRVENWRERPSDGQRGRPSPRLPRERQKPPARSGQPYPSSHRPDLRTFKWIPDGAATNGTAPLREMSRNLVATSKHRVGSRHVDAWFHAPINSNNAATPSATARANGDETRRDREYVVYATRIHIADNRNRRDRKTRAGTRRPDSSTSIARSHAGWSADGRPQFPLSWAKTSARRRRRPRLAAP